MKTLDIAQSRAPGWARAAWLEPLDRWWDRCLTSERFYRWSVSNPLTRWFTRRRSRQVFDLMAGFVYSQILLACVRLQIFQRVQDHPQSLEALAEQAQVNQAALQRLLNSAVALQLLTHLGDAVKRYTIVDLSGSLRARQQDTLKAHAHKVQWVDALPEQLSGVVVGNEVLDAMPVQLLVRKSGVWHERGVVWNADAASQDKATADGVAVSPLQWEDRVTDLRPPVEIAGEHDYLTEIHTQAEAFVATLADRFKAGEVATGKGGAAFLIDYGFPESEYFHAQRSMGTLMCHQLHKADSDPLADVGRKDITAHVNFTGVALAAQDAGLNVLGYTSQAHFLINCGLLPPLVDAPMDEKSMAQKLITEHEMGELFKVLALGTAEWEPLGFAQGDRSHTL